MSQTSQIIVEQALLNTVKQTLEINRLKAKNKKLRRALESFISTALSIGFGDDQDCQRMMDCVNEAKDILAKD